MGFFNALTDLAAKGYGAIDKNVAYGLLPGGAALNPKIGGTVLAAQEAVPAIINGGLGLGARTDTSINPRIARGLIEAEANAKKRGAPSVAYEDYNMNTAGGYAAKHTFGRVGYDELKRDGSGAVTGITQAYDTNKTAPEIQQEIATGGPFYKRAEQALAMTQGGGLTTHNVDFTGNSPKPRLAGQADITVASTAEPGPSMNYAVRAGDTLSAIARERGMSVNDIATLNNISDINKIGVGQQLRFK